MNRIASHLLLAALLAAGACEGNISGDTAAKCDTAPQQKAPAANPAWGGTVFTVVMENKSADEIFGNPDAPYINQLAKQGAVARGYHDPFVHPSKPNYLWMVGGQNFGILDDDDPRTHSIDAKAHLADQLEAAGISWKTYQEGMGDPCGLVSHGRYAAKHNPFIYFTNINGWDGTQFQPSARCNEHVVDYSQLEADIAANKLPRYVFITPDLDSDMHDKPIKYGDQWLQKELPKIFATDAFKKGGVLFLLWDEGGGTISVGDDPPFIAVSPHAKAGFESKEDYDASSYLKTVQTIFGLDPLPCADPAVAPSVKAMTDLFDVPLAPN